MTEFIQQFGDEFINPSDSGNTVKPGDALTGKETVMLYFSAHWCPPCRRFTPILMKLYKKLREQSKSMELVFCSLDNQKKDYEGYISDMPWLCMPFQSEQTQKMARKYKANGIPHLVIVDGSNGNVITMNGTSEVSSDNEGKNFPWAPKKFAEIWPSEILASKSATEDIIDSTSLKDKYLMLYFSAHWCPPCRAFTPTLSKVYTKMKNQRDDFELVFVSSDKDEEAFQEYFGEMTFCALPFHLRDVKNQLSKNYEVQGIPTLVMLGPVDASGDRPVINNNCRSFIEREDFAEFPFEEKPYGDLGSGDLNESKCILIFHENGDDDEQKEIKTMVKEVSEKIGDDIKIYWSFDHDGLGKRVRSALNMPEPSQSLDAAMAILDIPDNGGYYKTDVTDITVENIVKFIESPGERLQLE